MEYRILGRTGLKISAIGLGTINQGITKKQSRNILQEALLMGVNFIDTSRAYGESENRIGSFLKNHRRSFILCSRTPELDFYKVSNDILKSCVNLSSKYIDIYQLHNISSENALEQSLRAGGALSAINSAKIEGRVKYNGFSCHNLDIAIRGVSSGMFDTITIPLNVVEFSSKHIKLLKLCEELNVGIICMKTLAGGNIEQIDLAIRFVLGFNVASAVIGTKNISELQANVLAVNPVQPLTDTEMKNLMIEANRLGKTFCRRCDYCKLCPKEIDISFILNLELITRPIYGWNSTRAKQMTLKRAKTQYNSLNIDASFCNECGVCEEKCPYCLPIIRMLQDVHTRLK